MPLEKITERILSDARKRASEIESAAQVRAKELLDETALEAEKSKTQFLTNAQKEAEEEKKRALALARLEARGLVLKAKQQAVEVAFAGALKKLLALPDEKYQELMKKMLLETAEGNEEVIVSSKDRKQLNDEFLKQVNSELVKAGKIGKLTLSAETRNFQGGFILRSGGVEINNTF
ncbi:MAG: V-type ATP synthase subunit E family protein, partial [Candidatus Subteraquimicrobiales bacterium]|nr:V-type ATP synthase subunit E family protein [Candidatus Subteraquimicrobiales bacterium]